MRTDLRSAVACTTRRGKFKFNNTGVGGNSVRLLLVVPPTIQFCSFVLVAAESRTVQVNYQFRQSNLWTEEKEKFHHSTTASGKSRKRLADFNCCSFDPHSLSKLTWPCLSLWKLIRTSASRTTQEINKMIPGKIRLLLVAKKIKE